MLLGMIKTEKRIWKNEGEGSFDNKFQWSDELKDYLEWVKEWIGGEKEETPSTDEVFQWFLLKRVIVKWEITGEETKDQGNIFF